MEATVTLEADPPAGTTASVDLATTAVSADAGVDYGPPNRAVDGLTWTRDSRTGEYSATLAMTQAGQYPVRLAALYTSEVKPRRAFNLNMSGAENCRIRDASSLFTLFADRPTVAPPPTGPGPGPPAPVDLPSVTASNGVLDAATNTMVITIESSGTSTEPITGLATSRNGTALAGLHYRAISNVRWTIPVGRTSTVIRIGLIPPIGGTVAQSFSVILSGISTNVTSTAAGRISTCTIPSTTTAPTPVGDPYGYSYRRNRYNG